MGTPQIAESWFDRREGVIITAVEPGGPGDEAGVHRGDVILEIDRKSIRTLTDYQGAISRLKKGRGVLFLLRREERRLFLALKTRQ